MKKLFAIAAATAMLAGASGTAFAADRLADNQMDTVSAGFLNFNQTNVAVVSSLQAIEVKNKALFGSAAASSVTATQGTTIVQQNCRLAGAC